MMSDEHPSSLFRQGRATWWLVAIIVLVMSAVAVIICRTPTAPHAVIALEPPAVQKALRLLPATVQSALTAGVPVLCWSQQTLARFEPCGCVAGMFGGLARRATVVAAAKNEGVLLLEGGGWSAGLADHQRLKSQHYLASAKIIGVDACAIGRTEVALGLVYLREFSATTDRPPLVCANLHDSDGVSPVPLFITVSIAGRSMIVTSVAPVDARGTGLTVIEPEAALLALVAQSPPRSVVVMADLDIEKLRDLARAVPGLGAIIGGDVNEPSSTIERIGGTPVLYVANHGKTVGWWPWDAATCDFELLDEAIADDPRIRARINSYQDALGAAHLNVDAAAISGMVHIGSKFSGAYVGSPSCTVCHVNAAAMHRGSGHARAYATLVQKNYHRDPECLACHVTGLGQSGAFTRSNPDDIFSQVSCESCHGPGGDHIATGGTRPGLFAAATAATCVRCHDHENSPHFDFSLYWPRIQHGK